MVKKTIALMLIFVLATIAFCGCKKSELQPSGQFYRLEDAYEMGLLTKDDLKKIAYCQKEFFPHLYASRYLRGTETDDFVPLPKDKEKLSIEEEEKIKQEYIRRQDLHQVYNARLTAILDETKRVDFKIENVSIVEYYGTYNGYAAVMIAVKYEVFDTITESYLPLKYNSFDGRISSGGNNVFNFENGSLFPHVNGIFLWKNRDAELDQKEAICSFETACSLDLLTEEEAKTIVYYQKEYYENLWMNNFTQPDHSPLDEATEIKIKQDYLLELLSIMDSDDTPQYSYITLEKLQITEYFGTYNDCVVVNVDPYKITTTKNVNSTAGFEALDNPIMPLWGPINSATIIDDVLFATKGFNIEILVWKENS